MNRPAQRHGKCVRRRGLTLLELLLGVSGMALVATAMAAMLEMTAYANNNVTEIQRMVIRQRRVGERLAGNIRSSSQLLAAGADHIVLWLGDLNGSTAPSLSELIRVEYDSVNRELGAYQAPASLDPADDTEYTLGSSDFSAETQAIKGTANFPHTLWGTDVISWSINYNAPDPQDASLIAFRIEITIGDINETSAGAATLRNH